MVAMVTKCINSKVISMLPCNGHYETFLMLALNGGINPLEVFLYCAKTFSTRELKHFDFNINFYGSLFAVTFINMSIMLPWQHFY